MRKVLDAALQLLQFRFLDMCLGPKQLIISMNYNAFFVVHDFDPHEIYYDLRNLEVLIIARLQTTLVC